MRSNLGVCAFRGGASPHTGVRNNGADEDFTLAESAQVLELETPRPPNMSLTKRQLE